MAQRIVALQIVGAATASWTADKDYLFVAAQATSGTASVTISPDGTNSPANVISPGTAKTVADLYWATQTSNAKMSLGQTAIPVPAGTTLLVQTTATTTVMMLLEEAIDVAL